MGGTKEPWAQLLRLGVFFFFRRKKKTKKKNVNKSEKKNKRSDNWPIASFFGCMIKKLIQLSKKAYPKSTKLTKWHLMAEAMRLSIYPMFDLGGLYNDLSSGSPRLEFGPGNLRQIWEIWTRVAQWNPRRYPLEMHTTYKNILLTCDWNIWMNITWGKFDHIEKITS